MWFLGKCRSNKLRKNLPIFVETFLLDGLLMFINVCLFINGKNNCFITLKDHKENFLNNPKTRLLNPTKNELGRISKSILNKIDLNLPNKTKANQWKNTNDVISWFKSIKNKQNCKFISFDIKDFYPTITKELLSKCLSFSETKAQITEDDKRKYTIRENHYYLAEETRG